MVNSILASMAFFGASATALSCGSANVVNKCSYDVYLCNVPASGGGYEESDKTLASGESWTQDWTELTNGNGWSIKLSKSTALENILQYEYTFHNDGIIWYDLSCVNGNPWDANWEITASDGCNPKQQAYRYATDDAYGMQSCAQDASITVTLCSGEAADNSTSGSQPDSYSSAAPSPVAYSSAAAPSPDSYSSAAAPAPEYSSAPDVVAYSNVAPASASAPAVAPSYGYDWNNADMSNSLAAATAADSTPTTFATAVVTQAPDGELVTEVETVYVTNVVTAYGRRAKRHEHHPHGHRH